MFGQSLLINSAVKDPANVEYIVVAGGGGAGAGYYGGGGGAGGLRSGSSLTISNSDILISVGAGGAANSVQTVQSNSGLDSSVAFSTGSISGTGGGGGGSRNGNVVNTSITQGAGGGSGGGDSVAGSYGGGAGNTGGYTPVEGFQGGGGGTYGGYAYGNGGGGAGQVGVTSWNSGVYILGAGGGDGVITTIIDSTEQSTYSIGENVSGSIYFAGGGAGGGYNPTGNYRINSGSGNGGVAGYDNGSSIISGVATLPNTGGGGCGRGGPTAVGAAGGDGVIILKYDTAYTCTDESAGGITGNFDITSYTSGKKITILKGGSGNIKFS